MMAGIRFSLICQTLPEEHTEQTTLKLLEYRFMQTAESVVSTSQIDYILKMNYLQSSSFIYLCKTKQNNDISIDIYHFNHCTYLGKSLLKDLLGGKTSKPYEIFYLITVDIVTTIFLLLYCWNQLENQNIWRLWIHFVDFDATLVCQEVELRTHVRLNWIILLCYNLKCSFIGYEELMFGCLFLQIKTNSPQIYRCARKGVRAGPFQICVSLVIWWQLFVYGFSGHMLRDWKVVLWMC